jgi:hypothetical protein
MAAMAQFVAVRDHETPFCSYPHLALMLVASGSGADHHTAAATPEGTAAVWDAHSGASADLDRLLADQLAGRR